MKTFAIASIIALASVASAQLDNIPSCALSCLVGPLTSDGCSALTDFKCHCQKGASLLATVQPCVQGACSASDQAAVISAVQQTCAGVGVPISIPNPGGASSAAASQAASSQAASSAAASAVSSVLSAASSQAAAVSSASSVIASAASSLASRASTAVASASATYNIPTASASQFTGGAPQATKAAGLLGAAALAMLAL